jgi:glycosyltransferase involved in cell wall biosynthesis
LFVTSSRRRLSISFLIFRPSMSGGARIIARHARLLRERGHEVRVVGCVDDPPRPGLLGRLLRRAPAAPAPSHFEIEGLAPTLLRGRAAVTAADLPDADVVVASYWRTAEWMAALPPSKGRKVYFIQGHEPDSPHTDRVRAEATYRMDATPIVVSGWLRDILRDRYGRRDALLVPNAIDLAQFPARTRTRNADPVIGFAASRNLVKRTDLAIAACVALKEKFPTLRARALAAKPLLEATPDWIDVALDPPQDRLADVYAGCDLWLSTSRVEGFGLPILEALACGTPVVASAAGAAPDLIDGSNGVIVRSDAAADYAEAAARLLSPPADDWRALSAAATLTAAPHDWTACSARFEAALCAALGDATVAA